MKPAILFASFALAGAAFAADPAVVDKPRIVVGDTWTYRTEVRGGAVGAGSRTFEEALEVTAVAANRVNAVMMRKSGTAAGVEPEEADMIFDTDWNVLVTGNRGARPSALIRPGTELLKFPMKPGDSYRTDYDMETLPDSYILRHRRVTKVIGWEDITVPAGRFRALRVESEGTVQVAKKPKPGRSVVTAWYAPEVRRWVRLEQEFGPGGLTSELLSYKLVP
ncbi:MAG: hypothetical protein ACT4P9_11365 [Betaproteobacteria bacterium]